MSPTNCTVPPGRRDVFVNDGATARAQYSLHFRQDYAKVLRVVQYVAQENSIDRLVRNRKVLAVELAIIDARFGVRGEIQPADLRAKHRREVMRNKTVAAANVEHVRVGGQHTRDLARHVISSAHLAAAQFAISAAAKASQ